MFHLANIKLAAIGLAALVAATGLGALAGYFHGLDVERGRHALAMQAAIVAAHDAARLDAEAESARRADQARALAAAASASREARLRGQINALKSAPRPDCALPDDRLRDLNAAISAANGPTAKAIGMPHKLPGATDADGSR